MTHTGWPFSGFFTTRPGKADLFVLTFLDGGVVSIDGITNYDAAVTRAQALHRERDCQVKVLPVTSEVVFSLFGIRPPERPEPMNPALRSSFVRTLTRIVRKSTDRDARIEASDLLRQMGVMPS